MDSGSFFDRVLRETAAGGLMPARDLVRRLMLQPRSPQQIQDALAGQTRLAHGRNNRNWLQAVARDANEYQLCSREWIEQHIQALPRQRRVSAASRHCTTDIRLSTDPNLPVVVENAAEPSDPDRLMDELQVLLESCPAEELDYDDTEPEGKVTACSSKEESVTACSSKEKSVTACSSKDETDAAGSGPTGDQDRKRRISPIRAPGRDEGASREEKILRRLAAGRHREKKGCPIPWCCREYSYPKAHSCNFHIPTKLDMQAEGSQVGVDRVEALGYLSDRLVGLVDSPIQRLMEYANNQGIGEAHTWKKTSDEWLRGIVTQVAGILNIDVPQSLSLHPINSPGLLFHWAILMELLKRLSPVEYNVFQRLFHDPRRKPELNQRLAPISHEPETESGEEDVCMEDMVVLDEIETEDVVDMTITAQSERTVVLGRASQGNVETAGEDLRCTETQANLQTEQDLRCTDNREVVGREEGTEDMETEDEASLEQENESFRGTESTQSAGGRRKVGNYRRNRPIGPGEAFDSHFHVDRLSRDLGLSTYNLKTLMAKARPEGRRVDVIGGVANFCDPSSYPTEQEIHDLNGQGVSVTVGIHPKQSVSVTEADLERLRQLVLLPEVVGLGEVGIDHKCHIDQWPIQRDVLAKVLGFLEERHVLVLHCRGRRADEASEVWTSLFYQCKGSVSKFQRIHLHCFTGTPSDVDRWIGHFVNVHFGFTNIVSGTGFPQQQIEALRRVEQHRLLLETDAPYFPHTGYRVSSPSFLRMTAEAVARLRGEDVDTVLLVTTENGRRLYQE